jgi:hypothetical protein
MRGQWLASMPGARRKPGSHIMLASIAPGLLSCFPGNFIIDDAGYSR